MIVEIEAKDAKQAIVKARAYCAPDEEPTRPILSKKMYFVHITKKSIGKKPKRKKGK